MPSRDVPAPGRSPSSADAVALTRPELVLLVGSPRSGTTWLQSVLGSHPAVATPQETDLFRRYLRPLAESWDVQARVLADPGERRRKGLPTVLTEPEFDALCTEFLRGAMAAVQRLKPGAVTVIEKSPSHSLCVDVARRFWPGVRFIHMLRDGRDVAASLVAASAGWGRSWAPSSVTGAAQVWLEHVRGAQSAGDEPDDFLEVRYEHLHSAGAAAIVPIFAFCGIDVTERAAEELLASQSFTGSSERGRVASSILIGGEATAHELTQVEPPGFFRRGLVGGWRDEWTARERAAFAAVAGDLLLELGYEADDSWVAASRLRIARRRLVPPALRRVSRSLRRVAGRVDRIAAR